MGHFGRELPRDPPSRSVVGRGDCLYPGVVAEGGDLRASNPRALWRPVSVLIMIVALVASAVLVAPVSANASTHARRHMPDLVGLTRGQVYAVMRRDALYFVTTGPGSYERHLARGRRPVAQARHGRALALPGDGAGLDREPARRRGACPG